MVPATTVVSLSLLRPFSIPPLRLASFFLSLSPSLSLSLSRAHAHPLLRCQWVPSLTKEKEKLNHEDNLDQKESRVEGFHTCDVIGSDRTSA